MEATFTPRNAEMWHSDKKYIYHLELPQKELLGSQTTSLLALEQSLDFSTKYPAKVWENISS
jgi:hypothetical protein